MTFLQLALDDRQHDRVLVLEIAVHQARAHLRGLGDVGHARRMKPVFDETFGAAHRMRSRCARRAAWLKVRLPRHRVPSCQPPPRTLYSVTRFACSASRVWISACSARYSVRWASSAQVIVAAGGVTGLPQFFAAPPRLHGLAGRSLVGERAEVRASASATSRKPAGSVCSYRASAMSRSAWVATRDWTAGGRPRRSALDLGHEAPDAGAAIEETGEFVAGVTHGAGQRDRRKKAARAAPILAFAARSRARRRARPAAAARPPTAAAPAARPAP